MAAIADVLPQWLRDECLFCCWKWEERDGKPTKVPYNPNTRRRGDSSDPNAFADYQTALDASQHFDGIGVGVFRDLCGIDLDHVLNEDGTLKDSDKGKVARYVLDTMSGAYVEVSPSGDGLHVLFRSSVSSWFKGDKDAYSAVYYFNQSKKLGIEVYPSDMTNKYLTITGKTYRAETDTGDRINDLLKVLDKYMRKKPKPTNEKPLRLSDMPTAKAGDDEIIERARAAKNGAKFSRLFDGDWQTDYNSQSEADQALCTMLAFWTDRDAAQIDRLFRRSGLYREKWERDDYRDSTITNAIDTAGRGTVSDIGLLSLRTAKHSGGDRTNPREEDVHVVDNDGDDAGGMTFNASKQTVLMLLKAMQQDKSLGSTIAYDEFSSRKMVLTRAPWDIRDEPRPWEPQDDMCLFAYVQNFKPRATRQDVADAASILALTNAYDPLKRLLLSDPDEGGLPEWDGCPRAQRMLIDLLGAADTPYVQAAWGTYFAGAFMRAIQPGIKFDLMAVLYGPQGLGKSTFCKLLAIKPEWYLSGPRDLTDVANTARELSGKLVAEQEELAGLTKKDVEPLKAAISRTSDVFVDKYEKSPTERLRRSVLIGTTNSRQVLRDATGNRRFLLFECGVGKPTVDLFSPAAEDYVLQAWAELAHRYRAGGCKPFRIHLIPDVESQAELVRQRFQDLDEIAEAVSSWMAETTEQRVCGAQVAMSALDIERTVYARDRQLQRRIVEALDHRCPGWARCEKKSRIQGFGVTTCWERVS